MKNYMLSVGICVLFAIAVFSSIRAAAAEEEGKSMVVLNHVTGWSLDSAGYHPAVFLLLENVSGKDLSGVTIRLQGRFTDVHTLEPSIAKLELRRSLKPLQQFPLAIIAPRAYELPKQIAYWPVMEAKVMLRVGDVGDEGTETLLVTRIDATTQTQDEAFQKLNEVTSYGGRRAPAVHRKAPKSAQEGHELTPLVATAARAQPAANQPPAGTVAELFSQKNLPGLGDDFYQFEQAFGLPTATDAKRKDYTWARYRHRQSGTDIVVCSKDVTGKADLILVQVPKKFFTGEEQLLGQARVLAGKLKNQALGAPVKSVRYLSSGRIEITTSQAPGFRMVCMATPEDGAGEASYIITLNRLPQEASALLLDQARENATLKGFPLLRP